MVILQTLQIEKKTEEFVKAKNLECCSMNEKCIYDLYIYNTN